MDISLPFLITSKAQSHPLWLIYIYTLQKHANMIIRFFLKDILISYHINGKDGLGKHMAID